MKLTKKRALGVILANFIVLSASCSNGGTSNDASTEATSTNTEPANQSQVDAKARAIEKIPEFAQATQHSADDTYDATDVIIDDDGTEHVRLERKHKGLPVIGGDLVTHTSNRGAFMRASSTLRRPLNIEIRPSINVESAIIAANMRHAGDAQRMAPTLVVYARTETPVLAWDVRVFGTQPDGTPSEKHVIVNAKTGAILEAWDDIHDGTVTGTGNSIHSGTVSLSTDQTATTTFYLRDLTRGGTAKPNLAVDMRNGTAIGYYFTDTDNTWGNNAISSTQSAAVDAMYGAAITWDYFKLIHNRNGIANDGKGSQSRVHYGRSYNNAFWSDSCFCMTYGDGDGVNFKPFTSLDVVGHEMSHGVTSRTAKLVYSGESGGLNEATSDIFGSMVEFYANNTTDTPDYLIGEKLFVKTGFIRAMYQPSLDGKSADCYYTGLGSLDVHYSSGVANHFYYLLAEGSAPLNGPVSPTCLAGDTLKATGTGSITGIGRMAAQRIWYRALTVYMTSSTNYAGARTATIQAASDLYGAGSVQQNAVITAWSAVGLN